MTKSILTISQEDFKKELPKISFGTLKNLLQGIFSLIKKSYGKIPDEQIYDLERKQTKIWAEFERRKPGCTKTKEFYDWLYGSHEKRTF